MHHVAFPDSYNSTQFRLPQNDIQHSSMAQSTFTSSQRRPETHVTSFSSNTAAPMKQSSQARFLSGVYGSNPIQPQTSESFNSMYANPQDLSWNSSFQNNIVPSSNLNSSGYNLPNGTYGLTANDLSSSPVHIQESVTQKTSTPPNALPVLSHKSQRPTLDPRIKRPRETLEESKDEDNETDAKEGAKAKSGACARCKNLKVRCEFKTDTDPCKRCLNGGHDCVIPGRKKRRTPPKREHLLNQIREQASQIRDLMAQLEASPSKLPSSNASDSFASSPRLSSPVLSPTSSHSYVGSESSPTADAERNKAVEDWIAKAKQSFQEFDGYIGIGGAGLPKSYFVEGDLENPETSDEDDYVDVVGSNDGSDDFEIAVEHFDGEELSIGNNPLRHRSSASSLATNDSGTTGYHRRRKSSGSSKPAVLPGGATPFGLFGELSLKTPRKRGKSAEVQEDKAAGIANTNFFRSTPVPESVDNRLANFEHQMPHILIRGIISPKEAERLFQIYFDEMNLSCSLLDPVLYTAQRTCYRSPFLFTVICAVASRFYPERSGLYPHLMHYAQLAAGTALITGTKNVEMCSGYILLSLYPVPAKRWEDQRSWLYLGVAIRTATDLNLHLPNTAKPLNENHARELLNRTRVWLNCFNLDRSTGSQYGKPPTISNMDYTANHSEDWWKSSPYNMKHFDIQICAYNAELRVMAEFLAKIYSNPHHPTGLNKEVDLEKIATETDDELKQLGDKWFFLLEHTDMTDPQNSFRTGLLRLAYPYARLAALSYGFQHAFGKGHTDDNPFLLRCLSAASDVVNAVVGDICRPSQIHYFRHGPEAQSVFVTFASAFLVKLLQPKFSSYLTVEKRSEIRQMVQSVINLLGSPDIAIDDRHGPKLYSKFLKGLLAAPMARLDPSSSSNANHKARRPKPSVQTPGLASGMSFTAVDHPSPSTSASLSPPPRETALSFDAFAPVGPIDPFAPDVAGSSHALHVGTDDGTGMDMMSDFFQPPLPFDENILHSFQSLTDPSGWQDTALPVDSGWLNQFSQFQHNFDMDLSRQESSMFADNTQFLTGV